MQFLQPRGRSSDTRVTVMAIIMKMPWLKAVHPIDYANMLSLSENPFAEKPPIIQIRLGAKIALMRSIMIMCASRKSPSPSIGSLDRTKKTYGL